MVGPPAREARPYVALGRKIAALREAQRLSQRELGQKVGVSDSYFGGVEIGRRRPETDVLERTAVVLRADYWELLRLAGYVRRDDGEIELKVSRDKQALLRLARFPGWLLDRLDQIAEVMFLQGEDRGSPRVEGEQRGEQQTEPEHPGSQSGR